MGGDYFDKLNPERTAQRFISSTQQLFPDCWPLLFQKLRQLLVLSLTLFDKMPILQAFEDIDSEEDTSDAPKQVILFDF